MSKAIKVTTAINAAKKIITARRQWNQQDGPNLFWQGALTKQISQAFDMAIREACDATADAGQQVDAKARGIMLCIDDVAYAHQRWMQQASMQLPTAPPRGSDELHRVLDKLELQMDEKSLPNPAPIKTLREQGVTPIQIARMYGWKMEDGSPDASKVFEEQEKPGAHYDAKAWVHPSRKAAQAEIDDRWSKREPRQPLFHLDITEVPESTPLTVDEMIAEKVPLEQICRVHGLEESEVRELLKVAEDDAAATAVS